MAIVPVDAQEAVLGVTMVVLAFRTCWAGSMLLFWLIFFMKTTLNCNKPLSLLMPLVCNKWMDLFSNFTLRLTKLEYCLQRR